jgi:membrane-associated protein
MVPVSNLSQFIDLILHVDRYLVVILRDYGTLTYLFMFLLIFCETGLVVTPFLPGDSVIFALGALASIGSLEPWLLFGLLASAAVLGNIVNYAIGARLGPAVFRKEDSRFFRKEYLDRTHAFYEKYGGLTIIVARFMPIIRTFAPFVAGIGRMGYGRFFIYNLVGSVAWVGIFLAGGYFFGSMPFVKANFSLVALGIIVVSFIPPVVTAFKARAASKAAAKASAKAE